MMRNLPSAAVALYLFLCIVLGGSAQGTWGNLALQLLGVALLAYAAVASRREVTRNRTTLLYVLLVAGLVVVALQLIPLPPSIWTGLPGRQELSRGFDLLGLQKPALPLSEAPFDSVMTLLAAIPAIAAFCATDRLRPSPRLLAIAIVAATVLAVLLGAMQVAGGAGSWAYLYRITNTGAVGFFANQNHMATLLLASIPLTLALVFTTKSARRTSAAGRYSIAITLLILVLVGVALNGSLAGYGLVVPVLLASVVMGPAGIRWRRFAVPLAAIVVAAGVFLMVAAPVANTTTDEASTSLTSRVQIWSKTSQAIRDNLPMGTGLGTFPKIYRQYEDPLTVTSYYVNHAHNDYLELVSDLGLAGALLIAGFLAWWAATSIRIWRSRLSTPFAKASTIVTGAVLVHSLVDFPLRTAAISAIFAACLAIMGEDVAASDAVETGRTRHVKLG